MVQCSLCKELFHVNCILWYLCSGVWPVSIRVLTPSRLGTCRTPLRATVAHYLAPKVSFTWGPIISEGVQIFLKYLFREVRIFRNIWTGE